MCTSIRSVVCVLILACSSVLTAAEPTLRITVRDQLSKKLPCRIHLYDRSDKPIRSEGQPFFRDHFVCNGQVDLELPAGSYRYTVARGPEYQSVSGSVELMPADNPNTVAVRLRRISEIRKQGWYSSDLHIHRPVEDMEQLMLAEDLDFGPVITWWNRRNLWRDNAIPSEPLRKFDGHRLYQVMAGEDEREGGALLFFGLKEPIDITKADREYPSPMTFVAQAELADDEVWIDIEKPFWWDVPVWLASGKVDSIGIANNHMNRTGMYLSEAWGRPRDTTRLPNPLGNGFWTQEIYYHALNTGLRIPPSAGSASGVLPNPVGYNRVYVHIEGELTRDKWWDGLRAGRCFVTNGPMLLCRANDQLPGHVFRHAAALSIDFDLTLSCSEKIKRLELIHNGKVAKVLSLESGNEVRSKFTFDQSGWFLLRALVDNDTTFRFASTAPYYLELGEKPGFVSRSSVRFFQDWVGQRIDRIENNIQDDARRDAVLKYHLHARRYWQEREKNATDE